MAVTFDDVRRMALALPETTEGTSYGTPAFQVRKKTFVRLNHCRASITAPWTALR